MKDISKNITFTVSLEEANKIFKALGNLPFTEVYELIGRLNEQANAQLSKKEDVGKKFIPKSSVDIDEFLK